MTRMTVWMLLHFGASNLGFFCLRCIRNISGLMRTGIANMNLAV